MTRLLVYYSAPALSTLVTGASTSSESTHAPSLLDEALYLVIRMKWKAFFFEKKERAREQNNLANEENDEETPENYGFNSLRTPSQNAHMKEFEDEIYVMICRLEVDNNRNDFQRQLRNDVREIQSSNKVTVPADKSPNLYEMDPDEYKRLSQNNITIIY